MVFKPCLLFLNLFRVETLDSRFEPKSERQKLLVQQRARVSRWNTWEFYIYALFFLYCVPRMFAIAFAVSSPQNLNYEKFSHLLSPGWMGRPVDNSDAQYAGFRNNFPALALLVVAHQILKSILLRKHHRTYFDALFGLFFIFLLHGTGALKILFILLINFLFSRQSSRFIIWTFAIFILFANELLHGYSSANLIPPSSYLNLYSGLMPHWEIMFKCTMLRMLSFSLDFREACDNFEENAGKASLADRNYSNDVGERTRIRQSHNLDEYNWRNYIAYCLYAPLYIAGPILTFNDYLYQTYKRLPSINWMHTLKYALRFFISMLLMEYILHHAYIPAICETHAWEGDTPVQISMIGFFALIIIWLKLMIPWRFFRMWSLIDGIDPPENMIRCVANNYSTFSFWRSWHRSFNRWVVRYIYLPLGGSANLLRNSLIIFAFVAIWHDIQLKLLVWGWLVFLFLIPEAISMKMFPAGTWGQYTWFPWLEGIGAVLNIWLMFTANLIGFSVGVDGVGALYKQLFGTMVGLKWVITASIILFVGAETMLEYRQTEHRRGIDLRC